MKQSFQSLLFFLILIFFPTAQAIEPVSTSILAKVGYSTIAGLLFIVGDKGYNYYSKKNLKTILIEFREYQIQTQAALRKQSKNAKGYGKNLGPSSSKKVNLFVQMNTDPVPSTYEELVQFMAAHNFDDIRQKVVAQLRMYPRSEALGSWYAYECMLRKQQQSVEQSIEKS